MNTEVKIKDVMTKALVTVYESSSLERIIELFKASTIHHLLVTDKCGQLTGIVSKEDLLKMYFDVSMNTGGKTYSDKWYSSMIAKDIMTPNPMTVDPDDHIGLAADIFYANQFRALPVVEIDELQGIITPYDLLKHAYSEVQGGDENREELRPISE